MVFPADWSRVGLRAGEGLVDALDGADIVVHAASDPFVRNADVEAARVLAKATERSSVDRIVFIQIAGIQSAAGASRYYRDKLISERVLKDGATPCTVISVTQFHSLIDLVLTKLSAGPILPLPRFSLQPVDVGFVADHIAEMLLTSDVTDTTIRGPEKLTSREMAGAWQGARGHRKPIVTIPGFGPLAAFGSIESVVGVSGGITWRDWLARRGYEAQS